MRPKKYLVFFISLTIFCSVHAKGFYDDQGRFYVNIRWNQAMKWWTLYDRPGNILGTARFNEPMNEYTFYDFPGNRLGSAKFNPPMKTWYVGSSKARWEPNMSTFYFSSGGKAVWFSGYWHIHDASNREVGAVDLSASQGGPDLIYHIPFIYLLVPKPPPAETKPAATERAESTKPAEAAAEGRWNETTGTWTFTNMGMFSVRSAKWNPSDKTFQLAGESEPDLGKLTWESASSRWVIYNRYRKSVATVRGVRPPPAINCSTGTVKLITSWSGIRM